MTQQANDPVQTYETATAQARQIMQGVKPDQLKQSTPCTEWDVQALLDHMAGAQTGLAGIVSGSKVDPGANPIETLDVAAAAMVKAAKSPGGLEKMVKGFQGEVPAAQMLTIACMDLGIHTWDVAKATGQDTALNPGLVEFILPTTEGLAAGKPSPAFAAPVDIPDGASRQDKLLGLSGRKP